MHSLKFTYSYHLKIVKLLNELDEQIKENKKILFIKRATFMIRVFYK